MNKQIISQGWALRSPGFSGVVDLPNDYAVTQKRSPNTPGWSSNGFYRGGTGDYTKYITLDDRYSHYMLDIDGAYMCAEVVFNEVHLTTHPHGYTPILCDLTPYVFKNTINRISIRTDDNQPSTRWYSGAGIYRDVFLWCGGDIRIEPRGLWVKTPDTDGRVIVCVTVTSDRSSHIELTLKAVGDDGSLADSRVFGLDVSEGENRHELEMFIPSPRLWNIGEPNLYTLTAEIAENGDITDTAEITFGIRKIECDAENGLRINGRAVKLRGGCIHHDHGGLGACAYPAAEERKLRLLKEAGFDSIRTAHNPPSSVLLDLCDRMGIVVMDEAFDTWNRPKHTRDYHLWFRHCWAADIRAMVERDRVHPSVISYSIGNEVRESEGLGNVGEWSERMTAEVRKYDDTRLVTGTTFGTKSSPPSDAPEEYRRNFEKRFFFDGDEEQLKSWAKRSEPFYAPFDIAGYNYIYKRYRRDHEQFPNRVIWGSETHALKFYESWNEVLSLPYVIGDFTWTAYDNMGEAGTGRSCWARDGEIKGISLAVWPWRTCWQGDLDLCGFRRPQSYFREAVWRGNVISPIFTTHPEHYGEGFSGTGWHWYDVHESWTFDDKYIAKPVRCEVYTDCDSVIWTLNGKYIGTSAADKCIASIDIPYERGTLRAEGIKDGRSCGSVSLETTGRAARLTALPEKTALKADGRDLCYIDIAVTDEDGRRVDGSKHEIKCEVEGGRLLCIFSADPANEDDYTTDTCHAFDGRAIAVVSASDKGTVRIKVIGDTLTDGETSVNAL